MKNNNYCEVAAKTIQNGDRVLVIVPIYKDMEEDREGIVQDYVNVGGIVCFTCYWTDRTVEYQKHPDHPVKKKVTKG